MPRALPAPSRSFDALVRAFHAALIRGHAEANRAYLLAYHCTGQFIAAHLLAHQARAAYGARVDLEPGRWVKQKLRLRDLDCPEITTPAGELYLNNELLAGGHAVVKREWKFGDWGG